VRYFFPALCAAAFVQSGSVFAAGSFGPVPDEYESSADHSLGFGNSGVAAAGGLSAVKMNPAMLPLEKQYRLTGGYHWPSLGRQFYQAGVVDSSSSAVAAGVVYTSAQDDYMKLNASPDSAEGEYLLEANNDTPVKRRISVGLGKAFSTYSLGINGQFLEAWDQTNPNGKPIKGNTFGVGAAGMIIPSIRIGASVENLANDKIKDYSPRIFRAGTAVMVFSGDLTLHLDYRDRERVQTEAPKLGTTNPLQETVVPGEFASEKMAIFSFSSRVQDVIRLLGAFGQSIGGDNRQTVSGGLAVISNKVTMSYLVSRPYFSSTKLHQAVNMGLDISL
jgi:hypothetical protein